MKQFLAYIRVSTAKQGERGVSLQEQRAAIERHATQHQLQIAEWFEERETAAKLGRPVFNQMLRLLKQGTAAGVIIHKIDRSARNLRDWADLGEMIDGGIEVHFANESLDLNSRGGRLSADIQAVVAADYIRNLREETRKGFYGRIKQGLYPLPAPIGYLDTGAKGNRKEPDPVQAPLVKRAFDLYASGRYNLKTLGAEMYRLGLRNRGGRRVSKNGISIMLNNPFYMGLIRLRRTGETFPGAHEPLITKRTFDRVHAVLTGKTNTKGIRHEFLFRRMLRCTTCGLTPAGELQKGHVYYRCHTRGCTSLREDAVEHAILECLRPLIFSDEEKAYFADAAARFKASWFQEREDQTIALSVRLKKIGDRLEQLTDAYLDQVLDRELFEQRKTALLLERKEIEEWLALLRCTEATGPHRVQEFFELAGSAYLLYQTATLEEKRDLLKVVTSNRRVTSKSVEITLAEPFRSIAERNKSSNGGPCWDIPRTISQLLGSLVKFCSSVEMRSGKI